MSQPRVNHGYNALLAASITAVVMLFNRGIPWWAWILSFLVILAFSELFSRMMVGGAGRGRWKRSRRLFVYAATFAVAIIVSAIIFMTV